MDYATSQDVVPLFLACILSRDLLRSLREFYSVQLMNHLAEIFTAGITLRFSESPMLISSQSVSPLVWKDDAIRPKSHGVAAVAENAECPETSKVIRGCRDALLPVAFYRAATRSFNWFA